jgi:hypothetical protein
MPQESQYVQQFWPSLAQLTGRPMPGMEPGLASQRTAPPLGLGAQGGGPVREFGKRQFGPGAPRPQLETVAAPRPAPQSALEEAPQEVPAPSIGARANPPAKEGDGDMSFWKLTEKMSDDDKKKIMADFESSGIDIERQYQELVSMGEIDPGMIKKGKDGKLDKQDMGLFLMEFGLRTMAAGGAGKNFGQAVGESALETVSDRRARGKLKREEKKQELEMAYRRSEDEQARKERGLGAVAKEQDRLDRAMQKGVDLQIEKQRDERLAKERELQREAMQAERGADRASREAIAAENRAAREAEAQARREQMESDKLAIRDKDVSDLVAKHISSLDENIRSTITVNGQPVRWKDATPAQRADYARGYAMQIRSTFGAGRDVQPGNSGKLAWEE